jgi:hypothetical protein
MRNPLIITALAVTTLLGTPSQAQTLPEITVLGKIQPPARYYMSASDVHEVSGRYAMSDGSELQIKDRNRRLQLQVDGRKVELYAVGNHVYSNPLRDVVLAWVPDGSNSAVALTYVPTAALAQANPPRVTVNAIAAR